MRSKKTLPSRVTKADRLFNMFKNLPHCTPVYYYMAVLNEEEVNILAAMRSNRTLASFGCAPRILSPAVTYLLSNGRPSCCQIKSIDSQEEALRRLVSFIFN